MELKDIVRTRRSIRAFERRRVDADTVHAVLEAANAAPSAGNLQALEIVCVEDEERRAALARAANDQACLTAAPVCLVFFANPARAAGRYGRRGRELYCVQDATIACTFAQLRATDLGLGSVWVGAFLDDAVRRVLGAPKELQPVSILAMGHPAESPPPTPRRGVESLVRRDGWARPLRRSPPARKDRSGADDSGRDNRPPWL